MAREPRKSTTTRRKRVTLNNPLGDVEIGPTPRPVEEAIQQAELTVETALQTIRILRAQVEACRTAFFRLAQCRAADMVIYQGKSWDDAGAYINAEVQGIDAAIKSVADNWVQP